MICDIKWNSLSVQDWQEHFNKIIRPNVLQSYEYAMAICPLQNQSARWGLIYIDNQEAGLVQIQEAGILGNIFHALIIDRGPLWFETFGAPEHFKAFLKCL